MKVRPRHILIMKPSSLGDIVMALPALSALRRSFADVKISWLVRPEFAGLLDGHPHLDEVIVFDRRFLGRAWYDLSALRSLFGLVRRLRRKRFDMVLDLQGLFRTAVLGWLTGCPQRFGMSGAREGAPVFYTHRIPQDAGCIHVVDYYLKIVKAAGACDTRVEFVVPEQADAADSVKRLLVKHKVCCDDYGVLIPGSAHRDKCWPVERFAAVAERMTTEFGLSIVATGTQAERQLVGKIQTLAGVRVANLAGMTGLRELTALLRRARIVVSNDTGPGHIAAALGRPLVLIFGRANPARLAPYERQHCIAAIEPYKRGFARNNHEPKYNVRAVSTEEVLQKVRAQLRESSCEPYAL